MPCQVTKSRDHIIILLSSLNIIDLYNKGFCNLVNILTFT